MIIRRPMDARAGSGASQALSSLKPSQGAGSSVGVAGSSGLRRLPVYLKDGEVSLLLSSVSTLRDLLILRLLYYSALRVSEVMGLEFGDVDVEERILRICHAATPSGRPKNQRERLVPVDPQTLRMIQEYSGLGFRGRLFDLTARQVQRLIKDRARRAGIQGWERVTPHKLRHSFAVNWVKRGGDIERLRRILGHSSLARTQIYLQFRLEDVQEEYDRVMTQTSRPGGVPDYY